MKDEDFQTEIVRLRPHMNAVALHYVGSSEAQDMVQDALIKMWTVRHNLHAPLDSLATLIVRQRCIDRLRKQNQNPTTLEQLDASAANILYTDEEQETLHNETLDKMMYIISTLPHTQQLILRLRHAVGMEFSEISQLTGMSEQAVRTALSRARMAVKDAFQHNMFFKHL